ncbi:hypothetical protein [Humibacillus sp. DSM 29435]|uniref:MinD/ParA family ATP-binding protein n=1 Tax=Humibacillus sp. DSM 29435 TaxID=1869167 RepID=UPI000AB233D2|nr:hypothetical protein [Humibacillus sp. DSM 29435]
MSNDDTGGTGHEHDSTPRTPSPAGIPGYPSNTTVPGGFVLPLPRGVLGPVPTDVDDDLVDEPGDEPVDEHADQVAADPWSSTWDDTTWQTPRGAEAEKAAEVAPAGGAVGAGEALQVGTSGDADEVWSGWTPAGGDSSSRAARRSRGQNGNGPRPTGPGGAPGPTGTPEQSEPTAPARPVDRPSADDLMTARSRGERQKLKATTGIRKALGLGPGSKELTERDRLERIGRPLHGRKTVMVINTKGGGGKTLVTLMLATYLGRHRSGSVLAWDNNETEGTLGMRAPSQPHHRTVVDLLGALPQIADDPGAGTSELAHWVREQRGIGFDVLASADDDEAMRIIGEDEFESLHTQLSRFYRMIVVDTGNNRLSPNWLAAAARADLLVFATSLKDDTSVVAAKNLDALVAMGRQDLVQNAVCVISHTSLRGTDLGAGVHTREHFEKWVRTVVDIPYDPRLAPGLRLDPTKIGKRTHEACLELAASVVDGL